MILKKPKGFREVTEVYFEEDASETPFAYIQRGLYGARYGADAKMLLCGEWEYVPIGTFWTRKKALEAIQRWRSKVFG